MIADRTEMQAGDSLVLGARLGSGACGEVYKARLKDQPVAVKVCRSHDDRLEAAVAIRAFHREAAALARLKHRYVSSSLQLHVACIFLAPEPVTNRRRLGNNVAPPSKIPEQRKSEVVHATRPTASRRCHLNRWNLLELAKQVVQRLPTQRSHERVCSKLVRTTRLSARYGNVINEFTYLNSADASTQ